RSSPPPPRGRSRRGRYGWGTVEIRAKAVLLAPASCRGQGPSLSKRLCPPPVPSPPLRGGRGRPARARYLAGGRERSERAGRGCLAMHGKVKNAPREKMR